MTVLKASKVEKFVKKAIDCCGNLRLHFYLMCIIYL